MDEEDRVIEEAINNRNDEVVGKDLMDECRGLIKGWESIYKRENLFTVAAQLAEDVHRGTSCTVTAVEIYFKKFSNATLLAHLSKTMVELELKIKEEKRLPTEIEGYLIDKLAEIYLFSTHIHRFLLHAYIKDAKDNLTNALNALFSEEDKAKN